MKLMQTICVVASAASVSNFVSASTPPEETNNVARAILSYAAGEEEDDIDAAVEYSVSYTNWPGMVRCVQISGWSEHDKEMALLDYLKIQSTNDFRQLDSETAELLRIALCECRDLSYTNAFPVVRNWAVNTNSKFRADAILLYYSWCGMDLDFVAVADRILSTVGGLKENEIRDTVLGAVNVVNRNRNKWSDPSFAASCRMLYRNRFRDVNASEALDRLFVAGIDDYATSSNRMMTACRWLSQTNCTQKVALYLSNVTNQLMGIEGGLSNLSICD